MALDVSLRSIFASNTDLSVYPWSSPFAWRKHSRPLIAIVAADVTAGQSISSIASDGLTWNLLQRVDGFNSPATDLWVYQGVGTPTGNSQLPVITMSATINSIAAMAVDVRGSVGFDDSGQVTQGAPGTSVSVTFGAVNPIKAGNGLIVFAADANTPVADHWTLTNCTELDEVGASVVPVCSLVGGYTATIPASETATYALAPDGGAGLVWVSVDIREGFDLVGRYVENVPLTGRA